MGLGHIPWHETLRWAEHEGLDDEETETLIDLVERLDIEEHRLVDEKRKRDESDGKNGTART